MRTSHVATLAAVAQAGSITGAARLLGIDQSCASRHVQALERFAGVRLVDRAPSGARLTPAGAAFLHELRDVPSG